MTDPSSFETMDGADGIGELSPADYLRLAREIRTEKEGELPRVKIGFLSSFTISFVEPFFVVEAARRGLFPQTHFGAFGQFEQEVQEGSKLQGLKPDALVIAMRPEDISPDAIVRFHATGGTGFRDLMEQVQDRLENLVRTFRGWSEAPVLVANFAAPARLPFGIFDANLERALTYELGEVNRSLRERLATYPGVAIWDYAGLVRARGTERWVDPRLWALARIPVATRHQPELARHLLRTLSGLWHRPAKCLVLDLDNTLWGGVIGDDGISGIKLGDDFPGNVYKSFQRSVLALMDRGILLTVASKNDPETAERVFREHPEMLIRWEDILAARINWQPKSQSIREIASELNIGTDSMVLFDDNPVERAEVRANAPEVRVIEVPADPLGYENALWNSGHFDQMSLSDEDARRTEMYRAEKERRVFARRFESVEDFLHSLEMVAEVGAAGATTLGRVTQLVNRTNQFNLTTRRRSRAELEALSRDPRHAIIWLRVRDRFGDQGVVAVGILRLEDGAAIVDTFLMSCRMMNRHVEDALLAHLAEKAREAGRTRLIGEYIPSRKNGMVADFYPRFGFRKDGPPDRDVQRFALDLAERSIDWPAAIERVEVDLESSGQPG